MVPELEDQRPAQLQDACGSLNHAVDGLTAGARGLSRVLNFWKLLVKAPEVYSIAFCYIQATDLADACRITGSQPAEFLPVKVYDHKHRFGSRFCNSICPISEFEVSVLWKSLTQNGRRYAFAKIETSDGDERALL